MWVQCDVYDLWVDLRFWNNKCVKLHDQQWERMVSSVRPGHFHSLLHAFYTYMHVFNMTFLTRTYILPCIFCFCCCLLLPTFSSIRLCTTPLHILFQWRFELHSFNTEYVMRRACTIFPIRKIHHTHYTFSFTFILIRKLEHSVDANKKKKSWGRHNYNGMEQQRNWKKNIID